MFAGDPKLINFLSGLDGRSFYLSFNPLCKILYNIFYNLFLIESANVIDFVYSGYNM